MKKMPSSRASSDEGLRLAQARATVPPTVYFPRSLTFVRDDELESRDIAAHSQRARVNIAELRQLLGDRHQYR